MRDKHVAANVPVISGAISCSLTIRGHGTCHSREAVSYRRPRLLKHGVIVVIGASNFDLIVSGDEPGREPEVFC